MDKDVFRRVKRATVALVVMDVPGSAEPFEIVGTGFCVDSAGIVVTCRHVIQAFMDKSIDEQIAEMAQEEHNKGHKIHVTGPKSRFNAMRAYAVFYDTESSRERVGLTPVPVEQMMAKTDHDIGMAKIGTHVRFPRGYPALEIEDYENVNEGDEIGLCGFPLGMLLKKQLGTVSSSFTRGIVSSIIPAPGVPIEYLKGFQINIAATSGNSGGPVFSLDTGKVFGVLVEGPVHPDYGPVVGLAKAEPIWSVLEYDSVKRMKSDAPPERLPPDL